MNLVPHHLGKRWLLISAVGLIVFLFIQVFPITGQLFATDVQPAMTRAQAEDRALEWTSSKFGVQADQVTKILVTHMTDSDTVAYMSKNDLLETYNKEWWSFAPSDVYRVDLELDDNEGQLILMLHMESGDLRAWKHLPLPDLSNKAASASSQFVPSKVKATSLLVTEALQYAGFWGIITSDWEWNGQLEDDRSVKFSSKKSDIGEAELWLKITVVPEGLNLEDSKFPNWKGGAIEYGVDLPDSFTSYMSKQAGLSSKLSNFGYIIPQILMFVLAIIYTGTHGTHTSYRRGIFLAGVFFIFYVIITFNMIPGLRAGSLELGVESSGNSTFIVIVSIILYATMALLTYFSAVAGDGLWKSMGRSLWPRWKQSEFGTAVIRSMKTGYVLAFILLGAQSIILLLLEQLMGSFTSSDSTQSMFNMSIPWLLPLLAWCAGISEELQSRFFGIAVFRSWFVGGVSKLMRRELSQRTTIVLTTAAMIPPGLLWALGHVGYAIYPVYTRVIELVIMAVLFGWFMLRFGLMAVIFAHVTLNGILMGMQMIFDGLPGDTLGGLFSLVMPFIVAVVIWWLHASFRRTTPVRLAKG